MQFEFKKSENYTKQHETLGYFVMPLEVTLTRGFRDFFIFDMISYSTPSDC